MEISLSAVIPTKEDTKKYLSEFLKQKYPGKTEFSQDEMKPIVKEYLTWLIPRLSSVKMVERKSASKREFKGRSLISIVHDYTALDIETTGFDPTYDEIIEIGAAQYRNGLCCSSFSTLVKPENEVDDYITQLTGITNEMLVSAPSIKEALPNFIKFLGDDTIVGHNINFDVNFLYDNCMRHTSHIFSNNFVDTMRLSRRLFPELPNHKLSTLIQAFNISDTVEHRALSDAVNSSSCYSYMEKYIKQNGIDISSLHCHRKNVSTGSNIAQSDYHHRIAAKDIAASVSDFDESSPVYGKLFVFTGVLEKMQRKDAMQIVVDFGGQCGDSVTKKTNYLVLGNNDYCNTIKDGKSTKQKKAESLKLSGNDIEIISENVFYDMISE